MAIFFAYLLEPAVAWFSRRLKGRRIYGIAAAYRAADRLSCLRRDTGSQDRKRGTTTRPDAARDAGEGLDRADRIAIRGSARLEPGDASTAAAVPGDAQRRDPSARERCRCPCRLNSFKCRLD